MKDNERLLVLRLTVNVQKIIHREVIKVPVFNGITKVHLQNRVNKLVQKWKIA